MNSIPIAGDELWNRMERAVEKVQERLKKATAILEEASIPYAVTGENAVYDSKAAVRQGMSISFFKKTMEG